MARLRLDGFCNVRSQSSGSNPFSPWHKNSFEEKLTLLRFFRVPSICTTRLVFDQKKKCGCWGLHHGERRVSEMRAKLCPAQDAPFLVTRHCMTSHWTRACHCPSPINRFLYASGAERGDRVCCCRLLRGMGGLHVAGAGGTFSWGRCGEQMSGGRGRVMFSFERGLFF